MESEAILQRKPVVTLGAPLFGVLPESMFRHVTDLNRLGEAIRGALDEYEYDECAVVNYVAACMGGSTRLDFYKTFLEKRGHFAADDAGTDAKPSFDAFLDYTVRRVNGMCQRGALAHA